MAWRRAIHPLVRHNQPGLPSPSNTGGHGAHGRWSMTSTRGTSRNVERRGMPLDERERSIIQTARSTPKHLPELYVAGRMFFRFDPIFRRDAELARERAFGDAEPLQLELLTEEQQFDRRRLLRNDRDLVDAAEDLATRWGLDPEDCFHTVAFDSAVNFPIGRVFRREPDSGSAYLELRLYSEYAWAPVRRALAGQPWLIPGSDLAQFPESPARQGGVRLRGIETTIAAKAMARRTRP